MDTSPAAPDGDFQADDLDDETWASALESQPLQFASVDDDLDDIEAQTFEPPPVVALVVTRNPGDWFETTLLSLGSQDYPDLTVFVVDAGSDIDPTSRVAAVLPNAFVQLLEGQPGFAGAANQALAAVEGAAFLMLCHDDVVLAPDAIRTLVGEAVRSNAGIIGPKIVRTDRPDVLLEVGMSIDRFGVPYSGIEPGELDQEQHDGVRDVFYVIDAAMLIRTDLFRALGGFDIETFPGGEDLDLCWRARLLGARVMVDPDARVGHREAAVERPALDQAEDGVRTRNRVRSVLKNSSALTLLWVIPIGFLLACGEALAFLIAGRRRRAQAILGAWLGNIPRIGSILRARRPVQRTRTVHDRDIRYLQTKGSARLKLFTAHYLRADDRMRRISDTGTNLASAATDRTRLPVIASITAFIAVLIFGSRALFKSVPVIGSLLPWSSVGSLWDAFTSAWRFTAAGANAPAPAPLAWMMASGVVLFGHTGMARTLVVVATIPFAAWGATRLARAIYGRRAVALFAGLAYVILPVSRNAISNGRLGAMVFFAILPFFLRRVWLTTGLATAPGSEVVLAPRRIDFLATALWALVAIAVFPPALVLLPLAGLALWLVCVLVGDATAARKSLVRTLGVLALALVGVFPWVLGFARGVDWASVGFVFRPNLTLSQTARLISGSQGGGISGWLLLGAVALPLLIATGPRFVWVARGWALYVVGVAVVWVPVQFFPSQPMPAAEAGLSIAALGMAIVLGASAILVVEGLRTVGFGWRQVLSVVAVLCVIPATVGFAVDSVDGRWGMPERDWQSVLAFGQVPGGYRVLWMGDPLVLPGDPSLRADGQGFAMTRDGSGSARDLWPAPTGSAMDAVSNVLMLAEDARTVSLGHALAPLGVRYLVVADRAAPGAPVQGQLPVATLNGLARQRDLIRRRTEAGLALYENTAWIPIRSSLVGNAADAALVPKQASLTSAIPAQLAPAPPVVGPLDNSSIVPEGALMWGEAADSAWSGTAKGKSLGRNTAFGAANAYRVSGSQRTALHNSWQWTRWLAAGVQVGLWVLVLTLLTRHRVQRRSRASRDADALVADAPVDEEISA
jgi:GT2 family glycosyltransferase